MSFGFFGIQFGWGLQMGNMSAIYEYLGASENQLPMLWLAAPLTGLIVQPIIGHMSDRTWGALGRRRPYFLVGAILASLALFAMPHSSTLWMAAGLLWVLDASVNISMEPFRAFVADLLPDEQRTVGFAMQSAFIGAGAVIASKLPGWLQSSGMSTTSSATHPIPRTVVVAFTVGAIVFILAVIWTIMTTREYPPENAEALREKQSESLGHIWIAFRQMPTRMKQLAVVQFFTWMGLFCMWIFFSVAVPRNIFGATDAHSELYERGLNLARDCFAQYNFVGFLAAIGFLWLGRKMTAKWIHFFSLILGGLGLASLCAIRRRTLDAPNRVHIRRHCLGLDSFHALRHAFERFAGRSHGRLHGDFQLFHRYSSDLDRRCSSGRVMEHFPQVNRLAAVVFGGSLPAHRRAR